MAIGLPKLFKNWQVGDGRETKLARYVLAHSVPGDPRDSIRAIDEFAYTKSFLMNVGDEKGEILDDAVRACAPELILELGTYCGYSALRLAVAAPEARIVSVEFAEANAKVARSLFEHAGVADRIEVIVGSVGDGGKTLAQLQRIRDAAHRGFDFVFIDHDKSHYLQDLKLLLGVALLAEDAVVVADNVRVPGAPDYLEYMETEEGRSWRTTHHDTHVEYQKLLKDLVLVSERIVH